MKPAKFRPLSQQNSELVCSICLGGHTTQTAFRNFLRSSQFTVHNPEVPVSIRSAWTTASASETRGRASRRRRRYSHERCRADSPVDAARRPIAHRSITHTCRLVPFTILFDLTVPWIDPLFKNCMAPKSKSRWPCHEEKGKSIDRGLET